MLILTLLGRGVGETGKPGHFRTLFSFSTSEKAVIGLLLRSAKLDVFYEFAQNRMSLGKSHFSYGFELFLTRMSSLWFWLVFGKTLEKLANSAQKLNFGQNSLGLRFTRGSQVNIY